MLAIISDFGVENGNRGDHNYAEIEAERLVASK